MIIYNVTIMVEWSIHDEWLLWMKNTHIPDTLHTNLFYQHQLVRLLEVDEAEGPTYAIQYYTRNMENYHRYLNEFSSIRQNGLEKWGDKSVAFCTLMEVVH